MLRKIATMNSLNPFFFGGGGGHEMKSSYSNHFFCLTRCLEKMKKFNCQNTSHCLCFNRNRRPY